MESCGRWTAADGSHGSDWNKPPITRPLRILFLLEQVECGGKVFLPPVVSQQTMLTDPSRWQEETSATARQRCKRSGVSHRGNSKDDAKIVPSEVRTCQQSLLSQLPFLFSCQWQSRSMAFLCLGVCVCACVTVHMCVSGQRNRPNRNSKQ